MSKNTKETKCQTLHKLRKIQIIGILQHESYNIIMHIITPISTIIITHIITIMIMHIIGIL